GDEDRRVGEVLLLLLCDIAQLHDEKPEVLLSRPLAQQGAKRRVAVEAWKAGPDDLSGRIHERADRAVADQPEIQGGHAPTARVAGPCCSHARTARTSRSRQCATVRPGPTFTEWPCSRLTVAKPYSSVMSSPTNTGVLPRNGSSCMNRSEERRVGKERHYRQ